MLPVKYRMSRVCRIAVTMVMPVVLSGCLATSPTRIDADNSNVFQKAIRASFNMDGGNRAASEVRSGHAIEIGYQSTKVSSIQTLSVGQAPVIHSGIYFPGPNQLRNDFDFSYSELSWRMREFGGRSLGVEFFAGIGQSSLGITVSTPSQRAFQNFNTTGVQGGLGFIWRSSANSSIHARASYYTAFNTGVNDITRYELYYALSFHKNLSLHAGYSDWKVNGIGQADESDFHMHFSGPALVMEGDLNLGD